MRFKAIVVLLEMFFCVGAIESSANNILSVKTDAGYHCKVSLARLNSGIHLYGARKIIQTPESLPLIKQALDRLEEFVKLS
jgi:hypothetical protein